MSRNNTGTGQWHKGALHLRRKKVKNEGKEKSGTSSVDKRKGKSEYGNTHLWGIGGEEKPSPREPRKMGEKRISGTKREKKRHKSARGKNGGSRERVDAFRPRRSGRFSQRKQKIKKSKKKKGSHHHTPRKKRGEGRMGKKTNNRKKARKESISL